MYPTFLLCADQKVLPSLAVTLRGLGRSLSRRDANIIIVSEDLTESDRTHLAAALGTDNVAIRRGNVAERLKECGDFKTKCPPVILQRLLLAELFPELDTAVYLDADLLVRSDTAPLARIAAEQSTPISMCVDYNPVASAIMSGGGAVQPLWKEFGQAPDEPFFNAGVMALRLDLWRRERISDQCLALLSKHEGQLPLWDQDLLNLLLGRRCGTLDPGWNAYHLANPPTSTTRIVHFITWRKPFTRRQDIAPALAREWWLWHAKRQSDCYYRAWFQDLDETPWRGWRPFGFGTVAAMRLVNLAWRLRHLNRPPAT